MALQYHGLLYWDRTLAILDGRCRPGDVALDYVVVDRPGDLFRTQAREARYDVSEMSLSTYLIMRGRGDDRLVGLPVFPSRTFRHRDIYVSHQSGIRAPQDLRGARVGVPDYQLTAALWVRGLLADDHGVHPQDLHWYIGGLRAPGHRQRLPHSLPPGVRVDAIPAHRCLEEMLALGELDALVSVTAPPSLDEGPTAPRRLFQDYAATERRYFERTRIFPIMHLVVVRRALLEAHPRLLGDLYRMFVQSKQVGYDRLGYLSCVAVGLPWLAAHLDDLRTTFEADAFPYGVARNRAVLERALHYAHDQGLTPHRLRVEDVIADGLLDT